MSSSYIVLRLDLLPYYFPWRDFIISSLFLSRSRRHFTLPPTRKAFRAIRHILFIDSIGAVSWFVSPFFHFRIVDRSDGTAFRAHRTQSCMNLWIEHGAVRIEMPFFILAFGHTLLSLAMAVHSVSHRRRQWHVICENRLNTHAAEETDFSICEKRRLAFFSLAATLPLHYDNSTFYFHVQVKCTLWFCSSVIIISHRAPSVLSAPETHKRVQ